MAHFGPVPGQPVGTTYVSRRAAADAGVHRTLQSGICGGEHGAESVVVSGGYVDDEDHGTFIVYTGDGGRDRVTGRQDSDQELTRRNLGLARSCLDGLPVRVIRGSKGDPAHSPPSGYRYDGLFRVESYWQDTGRDGYQIWRFRLVALDEESLNPPEESDDPNAPTPPDRVTSTVQRIVRSSKIAESVKKLHDYTCQVCGIQLDTAAGPYAEGAHIKALGNPHNGPDVHDNLLCLCPNDHVLLDKGAIYIDDADYGIFQTATGASLGTLRLKSGHIPNGNYLAYHREHFARQI